MFNKINTIMKTYSFENLDVWKFSRQLVKQVYEVQSTFPPFERYGLGDQLRRAVVSISSNIAEGNARSSVKEQIHFLEISKGSLMEVYCQLLLAYDLSYIDEEQLSDCKVKIDVVYKLLNGRLYHKFNILSNSNSQPPSPKSQVLSPKS